MQEKPSAPYAGTSSAADRMSVRFERELTMLHSKSRGGGGSGRGMGIAFDAPKVFERLLGKNLAPAPKPTFYGSPPAKQLVMSERTPESFEMHLSWVKPSQKMVPFINTTQSLPGHEYFTDDASCAMDAINLALGKV